jgi:hypothetical protein
MKEKVIRLHTLCTPSSSSDKEGNLISTLRFNEPTVLDDRSAACGVILRCLQQLLVSAWIKNTMHTYTVDKEVRVKKWKIAPVMNTGLNLRKVSWTEKDSSSAL